MSPPPTSTAHPCTICNSPHARLRQQCRSSSYCSVECQQTDWPAHKLLCSQYRIQGDRPGPRHKRAIFFFSPDRKSPKFIWIKCEGNWGDCSAEAVKEYMGTGNPIVARTFVMHNPARNRSLDHTLELAYRDFFMFDGSARNMCIINAARGEGEERLEGRSRGDEEAGAR
jgi:hypothetical protein